MFGQGMWLGIGGCGFILVIYGCYLSVIVYISVFMFKTGDSISWSALRGPV